MWTTVMIWKDWSGSFSTQDRAIWNWFVHKVLERPVSIRPNGTIVTVFETVSWQKVPDIVSTADQTVCCTNWCTSNNTQRSPSCLVSSWGRWTLRVKILPRRVAKFAQVQSFASVWSSAVIPSLAAVTRPRDVVEPIQEHLLIPCLW